MENDIEKIKILEQRIKVLESSNIYLNRKGNTDLKAHIEILKHQKIELEFSQSNKKFNPKLLCPLFSCSLPENQSVEP